MPKGCCGHESCSCQIIASEESRIHISGSGQPGDPFVFDLEASITGTHNQTFDTDVTGSGEIEDPWVVDISYAPTAKLDDLPDVNAPGPANGQVLSWNASTSRWVAAAPTVAPTGAVSHDTSLAGDGSPGLPLGVAPVTARLLGTFATGVGLTDLGMSSVVQHFTDAAARTAGVPAPRLNALSMLDTALGIIEFWDGTKWTPLTGQVLWSIADEFLELSGPYVAGIPLTIKTVQVSTTTDVLGVFDALSAADLTGRSGVLTAHFQETGSTGWKAVLFPNTNRVSGTAYRLTDGSVLAGTPITGMVQAILY